MKIWFTAKLTVVGAGRRYDASLRSPAPGGGRERGGGRESVRDVSALRLAYLSSVRLLGLQSPTERRLWEGGDDVHSGDRKQKGK